MNEIFVFTWKLFNSSLRYLVTLIAPFTIIALPSYFISQPPESREGYITVIGLLIYLVCFSMFMSSLIFFMSQKYQDKLQSVKSNLINGAVFAPLIFLTLLIANAPIIAATIIMFNSSSFHILTLPLIIIGIYVSLKSTFAPFHLILESSKPLSAIKSSFISTNGKLGKILIILLIFYFSTSVIDVISNINSNISSINQFMFLLGVAVTLLMVSLQQIAVFKLYIDSLNTNRKENYG